MRPKIKIIIILLQNCHNFLVHGIFARIFKDWREIDDLCVYIPLTNYILHIFAFCFAFFAAR